MRNQTGFTLIELLIATIILMSVITLTQLIYKNFIEQDIRFSAQTRVYGELLQVTQEIRKKLEQGTLEGIVSGDKMECSYRSRKSDSFLPTEFNPETGVMATGSIRYDMYKVKLLCSAGEQTIEVPDLSHMTATRVVQERDF